MIGGTYYGEQTQDNVWTARIHGYICPMNNGQKHVIQWVGDNWQTTCTQGGNTYNYCTLCGEKEILKEEEPLGHDFVNGVCTRTGCGEKDPDYRNPSVDPGGSSTNPGETTNPGGSATNPGETTGPVIPEPPVTPPVTPNTPCANGRHTWKYLTEQATCSKEGRSYRICSVCKTEETVRAIPKSYHSWKYETVPSTCTAEGKATRTYSVCKETETLRVIPMTAHRWEKKTIPATTASAGRNYQVCSVCGQEETLSVIPCKLHDGSGSTEMPKLSQAEITQLLKNAPVPLSTIYDSIYDVEPSY